MKADIFYLIFRIVCAFVLNWDICSGLVQKRVPIIYLHMYIQYCWAQKSEVYEVGSSYSVKKVQWEWQCLKMYSFG